LEAGGVIFDQQCAGAAFGASRDIPGILLAGGDDGVAWASNVLPHAARTRGRSIGMGTHPGEVVADAGVAEWESAAGRADTRGRRIWRRLAH
jgi:hypothetical protein